MKRNISIGICLIAAMLIGNHAFSQEFDIKVRVVSTNSTKVDPQVYRTLELDISDFINKNKWTDHEYKDNEKIRGTMQITVVEEQSTTSFLSEISLQISRPVYNSDYQTPVLNFFDKGVLFNFIPGTPIQKSDKAFIDNLSSTLTYYAFLILGFDYDSFSLYGGEEYFQSAKEVFDNLPNSLKRDDGSWSNVGTNGRSKYFLIENILSPKLRPFRQLFYEYHRLALDNMWDDAEKNRAVLLSSLGLIEDLHQSYPASYLLQLFGDTKHLELVEIFKAGDSGQKSKLKRWMTLTSPSLAGRYDALK